MTILSHVSVFLLVFLCPCRTQEGIFYPVYHLAPPIGSWMNDPNGFCIFNGEYHLFYQFNPDSSYVPGYAHWGHVKSTDLTNWEDMPIALYPDQAYDLNGVFSGSAIVESGTMYLYYTSNLNHAGATPDHEEHQCLATSTDGVNFVKYANNPVINNADLQPDTRDPKVWTHDGKYYMVLGNAADGKGRVLLFSSSDKLTWTQVSVLAQSDGKMGYMYECPDFFELDGRFVLLFSPQGMAAEGDKYKNLYQTGYYVGSFDYATGKYTIETEFQELDHGHDIYATQSIDDNGRRVVIAWFDMWEQVYPEKEDGFTGMMTLPRILSLTSDGRLLQKPILAELSRSNVIYSGAAAPGKYVMIPENAGSVSVTAKDEALQLLIVSSNNASNVVTLSYDPVQGTVTLDRGGTDGIRRTSWKPSGALIWKIFIDKSSIELFCGNGEVTFSSRFFPDGDVRVVVNTGRISNMMVRAILKKLRKPVQD